MKDAVVRHEQLVLRVLGFNLTSRHPHHYVLHFLRDLDGTEELAILSWSILNDSLRTTLCLQYKPEPIACAAIYLAAEMINFQISRDEEWWDKFSTNRLEIEDICMQMLDLYDKPEIILCEADLGARQYTDLFSESYLAIDTKSSTSGSPAHRNKSTQSTPEMRPMESSSAKRRRVTQSAMPMKKKMSTQSGSYSTKGREKGPPGG